MKKYIILAGALFFFLFLLSCEKEEDKEPDVYSNPLLVGKWEAVQDTSFKLVFTTTKYATHLSITNTTWRDYIATETILNLSDVKISYDTITHETTSSDIWVTIPYKVTEDNFWWNYGVQGCESVYQRVE